MDEQETQKAIEKLEAKHGDLVNLVSQLMEVVQGLQSHVSQLQKIATGKYDG